MMGRGIPGSRLLGSVAGVNKANRLADERSRQMARRAEPCGPELAQENQGYSAGQH